MKHVPELFQQAFPGLMQVSKRGFYLYIYLCKSVYGRLWPLRLPLSAYCLFLPAFA